MTEGRTFAELQRDPWVCTGVLRYHALNIASQLSGYDQQIKPSAAEITPVSFSDLYDPTVPTVGFDVNTCIQYPEVVALINARQERRVCNIVLTSHPVSGLKASSGHDGKLYAQRGMLIGENGTVFYGDFPEMLRLDIVESGDKALLSYLEEHAIPTLTTLDELRLTDDKRRNRELSAITGLRMPTQFEVDELTAKHDIVIKPAKGIMGDGVFFGSNYPGDVRRWRAYYEFLRKRRGEPIIEERIRIALPNQNDASACILNG